MKISSSIIASNDANDDPDISGSLTSGGYNLIQNLTGVRGLNTTTDKQINIANLKIDAELRNHGSPVLLLALLPGSPAIDAIPLDACRVTIEDALGHTMTITTDQRSVKRPQGPQCDIGAFEYIPSG